MKIDDYFVYFSFIFDAIDLSIYFADLLTFILHMTIWSNHK